jgi:hypothetical protein
VGWVYDLTTASFKLMAALAYFFFLDKKERKNQGCVADAPHRTSKCVYATGLRRVKVGG